MYSSPLAVSAGVRQACSSYDLAALVIKLGKVYTSHWNAGLSV